MVYILRGGTDACTIAFFRLVLAHEGGYSEIYVPFCGVAVLEELTGIKSGA